MRPRDCCVPLLSPTEEYLAVRASDNLGNIGLFLREMSTGDIRFIEGSESIGIMEFGFSPDGSRIAYNALTSQGLYVAVIPAGIPRQITDSGRFSYWEDNETIVLSHDTTGGGDMYRVALDGSDPVKIEIEDPQLEGGAGNILKTKIPGLQRAFGHQLARIPQGTVDPSVSPNVFTLETKSGNLELIESNAINPEYVKGGFLTYQLQNDTGRLLVRPINAKTGKFSGQPIDVFPDGSSARWAEYGISDSGDLLFIERSGSADGDIQLWLVDLLTGEMDQIKVTVPTGLSPMNPSFAPDDESIVFASGEPGGTAGQIYRYDFVTESQFQFTFDGEHFGPKLSPDGKYVYFSNLTGATTGEIVRLPADNSGRKENVVINGLGHGISPDGKWLATTSVAVQGGVTLFLVDRETGAATTIDSTSSFPLLADFSWDNKYIAYQDNFPGQGAQIIVRSIDGEESYELPGISGNYPSWSQDNTYLYYATATELRRIPVQTQPTFNVLGESETIASLCGFCGFDINSDQTKLIASSSSIGLIGSDTYVAKIIWLQNWSDHLKREFDR